MYVEVVNGAAAVAAQHAGSVGVIDHHDGSISFGQIAKLRQRADVAVHGKDAVGDQQLSARLMLDAGQLFLGVADVFVPEDKDFCFGQTCSVDDGSMV